MAPARRVFRIVLVETHQAFVPSTRVRGRRSSSIAGPRPSGLHDPDGIFILHGSRVRSDPLHDADIVDVAPTVLGLLGIDAPEYIEGRARDDLVKLPPLSAPPGDLPAGR